MFFNKLQHLDKFLILRFGLAGIFSTIVDVTVFNTLVVFFHNNSIESKYFVYIKIISFSVAVVVSYIINSRFVFKENYTRTKLIKFVIVSSLGLLINASSSTIIFNLLRETGLIFYIHINISVLSGSLVGALWNLVGYKLIVFKEK